MSFWPRGRTFVRGWSSDLSSLTDESGETERGIVRPPNFTWTVMEEEAESESPGLPTPPPLPSSILSSGPAFSTPWKLSKKPSGWPLNSPPPLVAPALLRRLGLIGPSWGIQSGPILDGGGCLLGFIRLLIVGYPVQSNGQ